MNHSLSVKLRSLLIENKIKYVRTVLDFIQKQGDVFFDYSDDVVSLLDDFVTIL